MKDITFELLVDKLVDKLTPAELEALKHDKLDERIKQIVNSAILELEKETDDALQVAEKIVDAAESRLDSFKLFWYAVLVSLFTNIIASTLLILLTKEFDFFTTITGTSILFFICIACLSFVYIGMANELISFWKDTTSKNKIISAIVKDINKRKRSKE